MEVPHGNDVHGSVLGDNIFVIRPLKMSILAASAYLLLFVGLVIPRMTIF